LQAAVASWRRAALMLAALPLSALGGVLTALAVGGMRGAASLTGLLAVMTLALRASVLLGRRLHAEQDAARERAVPVAQSVLATAALLLPAAIAGVGPGLEFLHPLAVTMLGGLASLLLVQGLLLPALLATDRARVPQDRTSPDTQDGTPPDARDRPAPDVPDRPAPAPPPSLADSPQ
jgi:Cu/Ag efflux pump CusA